MESILDLDYESMTPEKKFLVPWNEFVAERHGADKLLAWMKAEGFFLAPASANHHLNVPGGLCIHTLNVTENALSLCETAHFARVNVQEAVSAALLHDLCKAGKYVQGDNGQYVYKDNRLLGHGEESAIIAMRFIELTENELLAIRWHMGAFTGANTWETLGKVYEKCPLALLLHIADMLATYCDETGEHACCG